MSYIIFMLLFLNCSLSLRSQVSLMPSELKVWLRCDSSINEIEEHLWVDISGNNNNAMLYNFQDTNIFEDFNFNPAMSLSDSAYIKIDSLNISLDKLTVMFVYQVSDSLKESNLWQIELDSIGHKIGMTTQKIIDYYGQSIYNETNSMLPSVSTLTQGMLNSEENLFTLFIGHKDTLPFNGKCSEILVFTDLAHDSITKTWETYLGIKYGVSLNQRSYYSSNQDSIWDYFANKKFSGQIIGIGRDDYFGLNQKQSKTPSNMLTIGVGEKADMNKENLTELNDLEFIILGVDTVALNKKTELYLENDFVLTQYGKFRVQKTGYQEIPTFLEINYSVFGLDTSILSSIHLLINRNTENYLEDFDFYPINFIDTLNKIIVFKDIYWDTDYSGSDLFCLATLTPGSTLNYALLNETDLNENLIDYFKKFYNNYTSDELQSNNNYYLDESKNSENLINSHSVNNALENTVQVYPTPSYDGHFELEIQLVETSNISILLINCEGKILQTKCIKNASQHYDRFFIKTKGEYQIKIQTQTDQYIRKIIII